jgi:hypothetical protein
MKTILHDDGRLPLLQKALRSSSMFLSAFILLIVFVRGSFAETSIMLDFNTDGVLPSAQGFEYISTGLSGEGTHGAPEASVFSVSGGLLHMNTAALGQSMGTAYYQAAGLFDPAKDLLIEFRMQLFGDSTRNFGIFALAPDLTFAGASFESGAIFAYPSIFTAPDPSAFHIYRIFYHSASRAYDFFIDGALIGTQQYVYVGAEPNLLQFGDLTAHFGFNGHADIDYIKIQNPPVGCQVSLRIPPLPYYQFSPPWNTDLYAHHSAGDPVSCPRSGAPTIQCLGCALTALSMALYDAGVTQFPQSPTSPNNPRFLNTFMQNHIGDFDSDNNVDFFNTTLDVGLATGISPKTFLFDDVTFGGSTSPDDLFKAVCKNPSGPKPVIVKVTGTSHDHYVLVTGAQPQSGGAMKFSIVDPGHLDKQSLDDYSNQFEISGFVEDPAGNNSALSLAIGGVGDLLISDEIGRHTGFDDATNMVVKEIPQSTYARNSLGNDEAMDAPAETAHSIHLLRPQDGNYTAVITGLQFGQYKLVIRAFSQDASAQPPIVLNGIASPGSQSSFQIQFASVPGSVSIAARFATFQSALDDIGNSFELGLINKGRAKSLSKMIRRAQEGLWEGDKEKSRRILKEFIERVGNATPKHIAPVAAHILTEDVNSLLGQIPL